MPDFARYLPGFCVLIYILCVTVGAFTGGIWASFGIGFALISFFALWASTKKAPLPPRDLSIFTLVVLAFFGLEVPFSSHIALSFKTWLQLVSIFVPLLLLTARDLQKSASSSAFIPAVTVAAMFGALALGLELSSEGAILKWFKHDPYAHLTQYNRGIAHLTILAFPIFAALWLAEARKTAGLLAAIIWLPAGLTESHTAQLALVAGGSAIVAAYYRPLWTWRFFQIVSLVIVPWPFYARFLFSHAFGFVSKLHNSWHHRMEIWDYLAYRAAERPLFGWGLGTTHLLDYTRPHGNLYLSTMPAPHAHNFIVELWVETGCVGVACGLVFLFWILRRAYDLDAALRPFAFGGFAAALTVALFGFDFWTDALWAAFALSVFAFGMIDQALERRRHIVDA